MYITDALVCGSYERNTSDRSVILFTREVGMLTASVRSVREERSKHRYALQDFSLVRVSLVRGKGGWRLTGSESGRNLYFDAPAREARGVVRNIVRVLRRFAGGETPMPEMYDDVVSFLSEGEMLTERGELLLTFRILESLGYVAPGKETETLRNERRARNILNEFSTAQETICRKAVQNALEVSHL